ncbi:hypothetical protein [Clostridium sp. ZBS18]|uniref:hypothetical protein n=1 Tax=Clostridium sp. ZBS18 TaxID=2949967 RepID=UPI00207AA582|nr:hypothetical protein [Clostridium sp. ZBS18]
MYITNSDLIYQLCQKINELSKLQEDLIMSNINCLESEANEEDKERVNRVLGMN